MTISTEQSDTYDYESDVDESTAADVDEFDEESETDVEETGTAGPRTRGNVAVSGRQAGRDKALIRRALAKFAQIEAADPAARVLAGEMVGADGGDAADLTVAVLTASKGQTSGALADLAAIRADDDMGAAALGATLPNDRLLGLWRVVVTLGGGTGSKPSGTGVARALNVVKAARGLTAEQVGALDDAVALTKKTV